MYFYQTRFPHGRGTKSLGEVFRQSLGQVLDNRGSAMARRVKGEAGSPPSVPMQTKRERGQGVTGWGDAWGSLELAGVLKGWPEFLF